jgi:CheY-like chemotaxis protein
MHRNDDRDQPGVPATVRARILIVEDNVLNRQVCEAATVDEALSALLASSFDLLLLDVQIPGGGAEALIREMETRPALAGLPIVAVTSLAMPGDRERLLGSGFQGYLSKPINTRTFAAAVEQYLRRPNVPLTRHDDVAG